MDCDCTHLLSSHDEKPQGPKVTLDSSVSLPGGTLIYGATKLSETTVSVLPLSFQGIVLHKSSFSRQLFDEYLLCMGPLLKGQSRKQFLKPSLTRAKTRFLPSLPREDKHVRYVKLGMLDVERDILRNKIKWGSDIWE